MCGHFWDAGGRKGVFSKDQAVHSPRTSLGESRVVRVTGTTMSGEELMIRVEVQVTKVVPWAEVERACRLRSMVEEYLERHRFGDLLYAGPSSL